MKKFPQILIVLFLIVFAISCKNEYDIIGLSMQDQDNLLGNTFTDTTTLVAYSLREDSVNTTNLSNSVLGYIKDPVFGLTQAGIYSQYLLSGSSVNFGTDPVLDSVVLTLQYAGYFGDTLSPLTIKVHELDESLIEDTKYYNFDMTEYNNLNLTYLTNFQLYPKPTTSITIDTTTYDSHIRIRLSDELGNRFLQNQGQLSDDATFLNFFKGLYIVATATSGSGSLLYINMTSSVSGINIYYHNQEGYKKYTLVSSSESVFYNYYTHDYTQSTDNIFKNQVLDGNTSLGGQKLYAQPLAGVKTKILFPYIQKSFKDQDVVINKAELVITNISADELYFFQPYNLSLQAIIDDGVSYLPDDEYYTSTDYFGGIYDEDTKEYRFRITQYIQQLILQSEDGQGIYLVVSGAGIRGNRLIFAGTDGTLNPDNRLRLELTYTTY
jgi:hypothetical protein